MQPPSDPPLKPRFILIGGFLGAGKTTALLKLINWISSNRMSYGVITNDQGSELVDTARVEAAGSDVRQVTGGCFCCRIQDLNSAINSFESARPDVIIAEPVGSCTDLVATVLIPLKQIYGLEYEIAPMSVVIDSKKCYDHYFPKNSKNIGFSKNIRYIYGKQLEEAEVLVLNKIDLLTDLQFARLTKKLKQVFPAKTQFSIRAKDGFGLGSWFTHLISRTTSPPELIKLDYEKYTDGEQRLGWFNATLDYTSTIIQLEANRFLLEFANVICDRLKVDAIIIAHLKISLHSADNLELAVVQSVGNDSTPEISRKMVGKFLNGRMLINIRAEGRPELISRIVMETLEDLPFHVEKVESFVPGKPVPSHRAEFI